jgi:hypothetical protein
LTAEWGLLTSPRIQLYQVIIDYWLLSGALVLLWLPRQWLRMGKSAAKSSKTARGKLAQRKSSQDDPGLKDSSIKLKGVFSKPRNWIDFFRAAAGGVAVCLLCFQPVEAGNPSATYRLVFIIKCIVLVISVLIQTLRYNGKFSFVAPVFFLVGLSFGLMGWLSALFAFATIWVVDLVLSSLSALLLSYGVIIVFYGVLLPHTSITGVFLAAALPVLPVLLSATCKRRLTQLAKTTKSA